ncbi:MAG: hypothetical protein IPK17_19135 [Chloroflexi bacterium]|uniref:hypothetical protein n=1 Tax=Candidatus Flexifilum breve TaxID=3140694 RepID=UPI0031376AE9|nr:hypothetical protein [Chloroflexota bacterium]
MTAEYDRAERLLHLALHTTLTEPAYSRCCSARAALRRGQFDLATDHYQVALTGADAPMRTRIYTGLSEIMRHKSEWELATQYAQQALDLARGSRPILPTRPPAEQHRQRAHLARRPGARKRSTSRRWRSNTTRGDRAAVLGNLGITLSTAWAEYQPAIKLQEEWGLDLYRAKSATARGIALTYNRLEPPTINWANSTARAVTTKTASASCA